MFGSGFGSREGIIEGHAYSVQRVVEMDGQRLILLRNPWGRGEWKGAWSDGSKEWTPEWMKRLGHRFGEDGEFWICYADLLRHYQCFERVRLFGPEWNVSQIWTTLHVPWVQEYNDTYFSFATTRPGPVVIVVSQLDDRYFRGLEGQYMFQLSFRVHAAGHAGYIVRSETAHRMCRSANVELDLGAGSYEVYVKIKAWRDDDLLPVQATIRKWAKTKRDKVNRIGKAYDVAHARGQHVETEEEKRAREAHAERKLKKRREAKKKDLRKEYEQAYYKTKKDHERTVKRAAKKKAEMRKKKEEKKKAREERKAARAAAKEAAAKELAEKKVAEEAAREEETPKTNGVDAEKKAVVDENKTAVKAETKEAPKDGAKEDVAEDSKDEAKEESKEDSEEKTEAASKEASTEESKEGAKAEPTEESKEETESEECESDSDNESLASFTDYSDGELSVQLDAMLRDDPDMFDSSDSDADSDEDNGVFAKDPWNAVAVVGLRVYHKVHGEGEEAGTVTLGVVRPNLYEDSDGEEEDGEGEKRIAKGGMLDVDDVEMDAMLEGVEKKKEVIMGNRKTPA